MVTRGYFFRLILGILLIGLKPLDSKAGFFNNDNFNVFLDYQCLNIDGVPIPRNSTLANLCCGAGAASNPICVSGFFSILPDALEQTNASLDLAFSIIDETQLLTENPSNLDPSSEGSQGNPEEPSTSSGSILSNLSALLSGGQIPTSPKKPSTQVSSLPNSLATGSGAGGGLSSLGGMGSGDSLWNSKRRGKKKSASPTEETSAPGGKYTSNGSFRDAVPGAVGPSGVSSGHEVEVVEYTDGKNSGGDGSGSGSASSGNDGGLSAGGAGGQEGDLANSDGFGNGEGSPEDAPDYLKRIHKKDSIFKIVSLRYAKEQSRKNIELPKARSIKR